MNTLNLEGALKYSEENKIEEWVHLLLQHEDNNVPFSDGLKLEKRRFFTPCLIELSHFERCCGPESHLKYVIDKTNFEKRVEGMIKSLNEGWKMPPLIINFSKGKFELNDGNHRFEALVRSQVKEYYVIIWTTGSEDEQLYESTYLQKEINDKEH